jgi:DNA-binding NarL/FixJ family response regulator
LSTDSNPAALITSFSQFLSADGNEAYGDSESIGRTALKHGTVLESHVLELAERETDPVMVGLIDSNQLSRECLAAVLEGLHPGLVVVSFASVQGCIAENHWSLGLTIYYPHGSDSLEAAIAQDIGALRQAIPETRIVVLSDVEESQQPDAIRSTLNSGAHGFIPTRTTGIAIAMAAIRFVKVGGTFAPLDQLLTNRADRGPAPSETQPRNPLTSRQVAVLSLLRQGKANKIIAYELAMSESTVKVHVRNIMRKMGATNRTQVAYKAQKLSNNAELLNSSGL